MAWLINMHSTNSAILNPMWHLQTQNYSSAIIFGSTSWREIPKIQCHQHLPSSYLHASLTLKKSLYFCWILPMPFRKGWYPVMLKPGLLRLRIWHYLSLLFQSLCQLKQFQRNRETNGSNENFHASAYEWSSQWMPKKADILQVTEKPFTSKWKREM